MSYTLDHNPFRTPPLTPQGTSNSTTLRPPGGTDASRNEGTVNINNGAFFDSIPDEAPPPYSLLADVLHGETTREVGPPRPFQSSQRQEEISSPIPQPIITVNESPLNSSNSRAAPPPLPPRTSPITPVSTELASPRSPIGPSSERSPTSYFPPTGPPPRTTRTEERTHYDPPTGAPPRRPVSASNQPIDTRPIEDGRPTTTPVPGHPLLLKNKLLVYPSGYECAQCKNVGYRNNDPSHPCTKCWNKYARPYCGALAYAPFPSESGSRGSGSGSSNFQRPLPRLRAPQSSIHNSSSSSPSSSSYPRTATATREPPNQARVLRRRSESKPNTPRNDHLRTVSSPGPVPPRINTNTAPPRPSPVSPRQTQLQPAPSPSTRRSSCIAASPGLVPPSGSVVYQAGDPRIGGRRCWRCEGTGSVSYFFLDTSTCEVCNGIGRLFR